MCGEAENGVAAIDLVQSLQPDLLVLDLSMPVMNGLDAARRIALISPTTGMVLFTAHASKQLEIEAKKAGVQAVLAKDGNISLEQLTATLQQLTSTGHANEMASCSDAPSPPHRQANGSRNS